MATGGQSGPVYVSVRMQDGSIAMLPLASDSLPPMASAPRMPPYAGGQYATTDIHGRALPATVDAPPAHQGSEWAYRPVGAPGRWPEYGGAALPPAHTADTSHFYPGQPQPSLSSADPMRSTPYRTGVDDTGHWAPRVTDPPMGGVPPGGGASPMALHAELEQLRAQMRRLELMQQQQHHQHSQYQPHPGMRLASGDPLAAAAPLGHSRGGSSWPSATELTSSAGLFPMGGGLDASFGGGMASSQPYSSAPLASFSSAPLPVSREGAPGMLSLTAMGSPLTSALPAHMTRGAPAEMGLHMGRRTLAVSEVDPAEPFSDSSSITSSHYAHAVSSSMLATEVTGGALMGSSPSRLGVPTATAALSTSLAGGSGALAPPASAYGDGSDDIPLGLPPPPGLGPQVRFLTG